MPSRPTVSQSAPTPLGGVSAGAAPPSSAGGVHSDPTVGESSNHDPSSGWANFAWRSLSLMPYELPDCRCLISTLRAISSSRPGGIGRKLRRKRSKDRRDALADADVLLRQVALQARVRALHSITRRTGPDIPSGMRLQRTARSNIIDGRAYAAELMEGVRAEVRRLHEQGEGVGVATLLVGDDYAAAVYQRRIDRHARAAGMVSRVEHLPADATLGHVVGKIAELDVDPDVSGILVLRPLPPHLEDARVFAHLPVLKDIE